MVTTREKNKGMWWLWNGDETISAANRENEENDIAVEKKRKRFFLCLVIIIQKLWTISD